MWETRKVEAQRDREIYIKNLYDTSSIKLYRETNIYLKTIQIISAGGWIFEAKNSN